MSEEMENVTEVSDDTVVLRKLKNTGTGEFLEIRTPFVEREISVPTRVRIPLYVNGELLSAAELADLGLEIVEFTQDELDAQTYPSYYAANPDLAIRVRQYKALLDTLGLAYDATTDDIEEAVAISVSVEESDKLALITRIKAAFDNVVLNLQAIGVEAASYEAWRAMPKLVKYLPEE